MGPYVLSGLPYGCIYALVGLGLVITYRVSGVFNLAFGAQAYFSAAIFYQAAGADRWPTWLAGLAAVGGAAAVGWLLDRILFRHIRTAPGVVKLVVTLGLVVALPAVVQLSWFGTGSKLAPPSLSFNPVHVYSWHSLHIDSNQVAIIVATAVVGAIVGPLLGISPLGVRMRAVAESPRLAELTGIDAERVGAGAWAAASAVAGLAGVLIAPVYRSVDADSFEVLVVAAIAAAVLGRLESMSLTVIGGLFLGVVQEVLTGYLPLGSTLARGLRPSVPFVLLLGALLAWPGLGSRREAEDPLAGVDPPATTLGTVAERFDAGRDGAAVALVVAAAVVALLGLSSYWLFLATEAAAMAIVFLSFTVLVGVSGQLSLCQAEFAGVGAFTAGQLAIHAHLPVLAGVLVGGLIAAAVGLLASIPALRMGGIYLALATFALGLLIDNLIFTQSWAGNGTTGIAVPRPQIGSIAFTAGRPFFVLAMVILGLCALAVARIRRGLTGRYLAALRGSEVAAAAVGIDVGRAKIVAFTLSAGIAGVGGALLGTTLGAVSASNFTFYQSLFWLVIAVIAGVRSGTGAVIAGAVLVFMPKVIGLLPSRLAPLEAVLFGLGALSFLRHQGGLVTWAAAGIRAVATGGRRRGHGPDGPARGGGWSRAAPRARAAARDRAGSGGGGRRQQPAPPAPDGSAEATTGGRSGDAIGHNP